MTILQLNALGVTVGDPPFADLSLTISKGHRIGLVAVETLAILPQSKAVIARIVVAQHSMIIPKSVLTSSKPWKIPMGMLKMSPGSRLPHRTTRLVHCVISGFLNGFLRWKNWGPRHTARTRLRSAGRACCIARNHRCHPQWPSWRSVQEGKDLPCIHLSAKRSRPSHLRIAATRPQPSVPRHARYQRSRR